MSTVNRGYCPEVITFAICDTELVLCSSNGESPDMPKLFIAGDPGMIMNGAAGEFARSWKNTTEATVKGLHFLQEDSSDEIAAAVKRWFQGI